MVVRFAVHGIVYAGYSDETIKHNDNGNKNKKQKNKKKSSEFIYFQKLKKKHVRKVL